MLEVADHILLWFKVDTLSILRRLLLLILWRAMNKKFVSVLLSSLFLLAATDAKPQYYGGYGPQRTVVVQETVQEQPFPGGVQIVKTVETVQNSGYGVPYPGSSTGYNSYGKKWNKWKKKSIWGKSFFNFPHYAEAFEMAACKVIIGII